MEKPAKSRAQLAWASGSLHTPDAVSHLLYRMCIQCGCRILVQGLFSPLCVLVEVSCVSVSILHVPVRVHVLPPGPDVFDSPRIPPATAVQLLTYFFCLIWHVLNGFGICSFCMRALFQVTTGAKTVDGVKVFWTLTLCNATRPNPRGNPHCSVSVLLPQNSGCCALYYGSMLRITEFFSTLSCKLYS